MTPPEEIWYANLYETQYMRMVFYSHRYSKNYEMCEDKVAETFEFVLINIQKVMNPPNPLAYIYTVLKFKLLNERKKVRYIYEVSELPYEQLPYSYHNRMNFRSTLPDILTEEQKDIAVLHYEYEFTSDEIADLLNLNPSTCRQKISRILELLRVSYSDNPDEPIVSKRAKKPRKKKKIILKKKVKKDVTKRPLEDIKE